MGGRVLITGAAGFIGSHLYTKLKTNNQVVGMDNFNHPCGAPIDCVRADVRDREAVEALVREADIVYHLAAQGNVDRSYKDEKLTFSVNVEGTRTVLNACLKYGKRMVFASTSEVYGTAQQPVISETRPLVPLSPYAVSKKMAEELCIEYAQRGLHVVILRSFNTYGDYQNDGQYCAVIPHLVRQALSGQQLEVYGDGTQTRDFMHVSDAVKAYQIAAERAPPGEPINFGTGVETSINEVATTILSIINSSSSIVYVPPRPQEVMRHRADISRARELGFTPTMTLKEGLRLYIEWARKMGALRDNRRQT